MFLCYLHLYDKRGVFPKPPEGRDSRGIKPLHEGGGRLQIYWKNAVCRKRSGRCLVLA